MPWALVLLLCRTIVSAAARSVVASTAVLSKHRLLCQTMKPSPTAIATMTTTTRTRTSSQPTTNHPPSTAPPQVPLRFASCPLVLRGLLLFRLLWCRRLRVLCKLTTAALQCSSRPPRPASWLRPRRWRRRSGARSRPLSPLRQES